MYDHLPLYVYNREYENELSDNFLLVFRKSALEESKIDIDAKSLSCRPKESSCHVGPIVQKSSLKNHFVFRAEGKLALSTKLCFYAESDGS